MNQDSHYELEYQALRRNGHAGWGGIGFARSQSALAEAIIWLTQDDSFPRANAMLLELGCGNGAAAHLFAQDGYQVSGMDVSATAVDWAATRLAADGLTGDFRQGTVCDMPEFADGRFNIVFDGACFHCLIGGERAECLAEIRRVLSRSGQFVLSSMCNSPKRPEDLCRYDVNRQILLEEGMPARTLRPLADLLAEIEAGGFALTRHRVTERAWWDHVVAVFNVA